MTPEKCKKELDTIRMQFAEFRKLSEKEIKHSKENNIFWSTKCIDSDYKLEQIKKYAEFLKDNHYVIYLSLMEILKSSRS